MARKPRFLTKLRIDEISSVDRGAGEGTRIVLMKRNRPSRFYDVFKAVDWTKAMISENTDRKTDPGTDQDALGDDNTGVPPELERVISAVLVAAPNGVSREDAMRWLLHSSHGRSLFNHLTKAKETNTMDFMTGMTEVAKADAGMVTIAKRIIEKGETKLTEHQFTELLMAHAEVHKQANESGVAAFSRIFSAQSEDGILLRKACTVCKNTLAPMMMTEPVVIGGEDFNINDAAKAYQALTDLANEQRRRSPELSPSQAFARVFEAHPALAAKAHRRPNASDGYAFPTT